MDDATLVEAWKHCVIAGNVLVTLSIGVHMIVDWLEGTRSVVDDRERAGGWRS